MPDFKATFPPHQDLTHPSETPKEEPTEEPTELQGGLEVYEDINPEDGYSPEALFRLSLENLITLTQEDIHHREKPKIIGKLQGALQLFNLV